MQRQHPKMHRHQVAMQERLLLHTQWPQGR